MIHKIFPELIFQSRLKIPKKRLQEYIEIILNQMENDDINPKRVTIKTTNQNLHQKDELRDLMALAAISINKYLYEHLKLSNRYSKFFIGRCWPVIQLPLGEGDLHFHVGALFSGIIYLQVPPGSGGIEFVKSLVVSSDFQFKTEYNEINSSVYKINPSVGDIILFNSELKHRALQSSNEQLLPRVAVAFDIYGTTHIRNLEGGMPHFENLEQIDSFLE